MTHEEAIEAWLNQEGPLYITNDNFTPTEMRIVFHEDGHLTLYCDCGQETDFTSYPKPGDRLLCRCGCGIDVTSVEPADA